MASRPHHLVLRAFLLKPHAADYREFDERFGFLFNSYYVAAGPRHARPERGLITRPNVEEVAAYRAHVDAAVDQLLRQRGSGDAGKNRADRRDRAASRAAASGADADRHPARLCAEPDPSRPTMRPGSRRRSKAASDYARIPSGIRSIGFDGDGFCFDNEQPAHQVLLQEAVIARHLVTNGEWLKFMADGGYTSHDLWLSDGWAKVEAEGWDAPGYWRNIDGAWFTLTLGGVAAGRSGGAGPPRQLLRGRRLRALGRKAPADRGGMGGCGPRRAAIRRLRRGLAMDAERLSAVSGLSRHRRRARRIQRQVHDQPDGPARIIAGHARGARARQLSQLLSIRRRAGSSAASGSSITAEVLHDGAGTKNSHRHGGHRIRHRRGRRIDGDAEAAVAEVFLRQRRLRAVRAHHRAAGVLSDAPRDRHPQRARRRHRSV